MLLRQQPTKSPLILCWWVHPHSAFLSPLNILQGSFRFSSFPKEGAHSVQHLVLPYASFINNLSLYLYRALQCTLVTPPVVWHKNERYPKAKFNFSSSALMHCCPFWKPALSLQDHLCILSTELLNSYSRPHLSFMLIPLCWSFFPNFSTFIFLPSVYYISAAGVTSFLLQ